jgi:type VI secretion system secreted protein VgrG
LQSGVVVGDAGEEVFPDDTGRVRVQLHWDREGAHDGASGKWMRVAQRGTADSLLLPRVGWNVMTFNEEGTLDAPSVLSRIHDAEHPPTYPLPDNKTRLVFKTATTPGGGSFNEIYYEDTKGAEEMFLNASRDMAVLVRNNKTDDVRRDTARAVGINHDLAVGIDQAEHVVVDQAIAIGVDETAKITGDRTKIVMSDESVSIGGGRRLSTGMVHTDQVAQNRTLKVGAALIDVTLGNIAARAPVEHVLVGGAAVKVSADSIRDKLGKASAQTIGAVKLEMTDKSRPIQVGKKYVETVGGAMVLKTDDEFSDMADTTSTLAAGGMLSAKAPDVLIEATDKIELRCGATTITLLPSSIEVSSPTLDLTSCSHLEAVAPKIEHN